MTDRNGVDSRDEGSMTLQDVWGAVRRHARLLMGVTTAVVALVMLATALLPPAYESEAAVRIRSESPGGGMLAQLAPLAELGGLGGLADDDVDTEIGVLRSRRIVAAVADSVGLHVELTSPRRARSLYLQVIEAGEDAIRGDYTLTRRADGTYAVSVRSREGPVSAPAAVRIGEPFRIGNMTLALPSRLSADPPAGIAFEVGSFNRTVEKVREDKLSVDRQQSGSSLIEVTFRHRDPWIAAGVVNGIVERFTEYSLRQGQADSRREVEVLRGQVAMYEEQLREAEERLREFQERERIVAPEEQAVAQVTRLAELQAARDAMEVEGRALAQVIADVRSRPAGARGESPYRELATFPSFLANGAVQDHLQALVELESERAELIARRTDENLDVRAIDTRVAELENQLHRMASSYVESLRTQIASADRSLAMVGGEIAQIPAKEVEYARLARDRKLIGEVYLLLQTQLKEAEVQEAIADSGVRIVDTAIVPEKPEFPKPWINLALGTVLGLMIGLMAVVGKEVMDPHVRSHRDAERAIAGVPLLGMIPAPAGGGHDSPNGRRSRLDRLVSFGRGGGVGPGDHGLVVVRDPWDPTSESYRALGANLASAGLTGADRVLVVTGPAPGAGKSNVAGNLALTLARQGVSTLLVDGDLRRGALHAKFGVDRDPGLAQVLAGEVGSGDAIRRVQPSGRGATLDLLPAGHGEAHPAELLGSERLRTLLDELRGHYAVVLLDTPPLSAAADAAVLGGLADAAILVTRSGATRIEELQEAAAKLRRAGVPIGGVVLTGMPREKAGQYAG